MNNSNEKYNLHSYEICNKSMTGFKQSALLGMFDNESMPLIYFQKPKWLSEKSFLEIVNALSLNLTKGCTIYSVDFEKGESK